MSNKTPLEINARKKSTLWVLYRLFYDFIRISLYSIGLGQPIFSMISFVSLRTEMILR